MSRRELIREPVAEFFGVMILIIFGNGVDCQVTLSAHSQVASSQFGVSVILPQIDQYISTHLVLQSYLSISFGWAVGKI